MSWTIPGGCWQQPDDEAGRTGEGEATFTVSFKGDYEALRAAMGRLERGDAIAPGAAAASWALRRTAGGLGVLTIQCADAAGWDAGSGGGLSPLKDVWSIRSVRNDVSIYAYCGGVSEDAANRAQLEAWRKEPDGEKAKNYTYVDTDGADVTLAGTTLDVARKIAAGVESVMRFYAVVTRRRTYTKAPPACLENLGYIDAPPAPGLNARSPTGLAAAVAARQWVKCQDDADEQADGTWIRTEAWMGILTADAEDGGPWDANLYGTEGRWAMPHAAG